MVDGKDVDCVRGGRSGINVNAVGDERAGEALKGEARGSESL